jgi:hypothetical protein
MVILSLVRHKWSTHSKKNNMCSSVDLYDSLIVWLLQFFDCMILWLCDSLIVWFVDCMIWLYECMTCIILWLCDCMILWLCGLYYSLIVWFVLFFDCMTWMILWLYDLFFDCMACVIVWFAWLYDCSIKWLGALLPWIGCGSLAGYLPSYYSPFILLGRLKDKKTECDLAESNP